MNVCYFAHWATFHSEVKAILRQILSIWIAFTFINFEWREVNTENNSFPSKSVTWKMDKNVVKFISLPSFPFFDIAGLMEFLAFGNEQRMS